MELIYVVVLFVMMFMDIALIFVKAGLLNVLFGFLSLTLMGIALVEYAAEIPFHPYPEIALGLTGSFCMLVAAARFKGWV